MTPQNVGITDLSRSAYESACRDFWRASVKMETGRRPCGFESHQLAACFTMECGTVASTALQRNFSASRELGGAGDVELTAELGLNGLRERHVRFGS